MTKKAIFVANTGFGLYNFKLSTMKYLADRGWEVLAVANDEADFSDKFARHGLRFVNIEIDHKGTNPLKDVEFAARLRAIYKRERPCLVHHFTIKPVIFGSLVAKSLRVPAIVNSVEGLGYAFIRGGWLKALVTGLYRVALSGQGRVIFSNEDNYRLFVKRGIIEAQQGYVVFGIGVNTKQVKPAKRKYLGEMRFVLVSRMLWSKGVAQFVTAAENLKKGFPEIKCIMAGGVSGGGAVGNPDAVTVEWLNRVNQDGYVTWVGRLNPDEVMELLDQSDVFVLPSYYPEGLPRSLMEAAAKGKAIITTNMPGCKEVVDDGISGFLIPPRSVDALAGRMLQFVHHPDLVDKMGAESRKKAEHVFDEAIILERTADVYRDAGIL
jgi:glycosyltransferase involved in cell wall biosynthesis